MLSRILGVLLVRVGGSGADARPRRDDVEHQVAVKDPAPRFHRRPRHPHCLAPAHRLGDDVSLPVRRECRVDPDVALALDTEVCAVQMHRM